MTGEVLTQFGRLVGVRIYPVAGAPIWVNPTQPRAAGVQLVPELRVIFAAQKSTTAEPQRAQIALVNLGKLTRDAIASYARRPQGVTSAGLTVDGRVYRGTQVELLAGYQGVGGAASIFRGDLSDVRSEHQGTEWVTTLSVGDSEAALTQAEIAQTFPPGTPAVAVIQACLATMGLALGPAPIPEPLASYVLLRGWPAFGRSRDVIDAILAGVVPDLSQLPQVVKAAATLASLTGLLSGPSPLTRPIDLFVDDGLAYLQPRSVALPGVPIQVAAEAVPGAVRLLERPQRLDDGGVRVRCLLTPALTPAAPVSITSRELAGAYRVEAVEHAGDNRGGSFTTTADLRPVIPLAG